ncbi:hypothetical protein GGX14DRAFT_385500 [Mycena pura]|uniref:Uncharacterized protein n=1 Tax=Mycena pura TaxID=153505 RepID=A0AAD6YQN4_9AGAR|nr:hypothetical protein GGX14DRAFT_385500 [Mycena pura]
MAPAVPPMPATLPILNTAAVSRCPPPPPPAADADAVPRPPTSDADACPDTFPRRLQPDADAVPDTPTPDADAPTPMHNTLTPSPAASMPSAKTHVKARTSARGSWPYRKPCRPDSEAHGLRYGMAHTVPHKHVTEDVSRILRWHYNYRPTLFAVCGLKRALLRRTLPHEMDFHAHPPTAIHPMGSQHEFDVRPTAHTVHLPHVCPEEQVDQYGAAVEGGEDFGGLISVTVRDK